MIKLHHKEGVFAPYFNNLCRRKDGVIIFLGGRPEMDQLIFPSVDALCSTLPSGYERDSDFIDS